MAYAISVFDRSGLDALVNGIAGLFARGGGVLRTTQTGRVQNYAAFLFGALVVIGAALVAFT